MQNLSRACVILNDCNVVHRDQNNGVRSSFVLPCQSSAADIIAFMPSRRVAEAEASGANLQLFNCMCVWFVRSVTFSQRPHAS